jgi:hypothetical protein
MNHSIRDGELGGSKTEAGSASDYRIREIEARLDRRVAAIETWRMGSTWGRRLLWIGLVVALVTQGVVFTAVVRRDGAWTVETLSAEEIVLRDAEGFERGRLITDSDGRAELALSDRDGQPRIRLTVLGDGSPGVTINDARARPRVVLGSLADGTTNLVVADAEGTSRAVFGVEPNGSAQALFADRTGVIRTLVGVDADGVPSVATYEGDPAQVSPAP